MIDPNIRLQNVALEHAELVARRSMSWAESTNRTTMFMTVVGAAVVALALLAQAGVAGGGLALVALVIFIVVVMVGLTTLLRIAQLDMEDMRWIQGLNRLRAIRLELDPGLAPYLVTSPHDDFESVITAYTTQDASPAYAFGTLIVLLLTVNAVIVGVVAGLVAVNLGADATMSLAVGIVGAIGFVLGTGLWMYRGVQQTRARVVALVPAASAPTATPQRTPQTAPGESDVPAADHAANAASADGPAAGGHPA